MNIFIIEWSLSLSQYLFRLREGSSCSPKEKNSCFKGNYKNCSFVLHFFHTDFVAVWLWSENELQKLKAVKFSWISLSISVYYLKTLLQPNPTLNHEINQSFLIRSRLRKKLRCFFNVWAIWTLHCSGYASPPCSRQHVQTFLARTSAAEWWSW